MVHQLEPVHQPELVHQLALVAQSVTHQNIEEKHSSYVEPTVQPTAEPTTKTVISQQPDIIPVHHESSQPEIIETLPPPVAFSNGNGPAHDTQHEQTFSNIPAVEESIYSNVGEIENIYSNTEAANGANKEQMTNSGALVGDENCDLAEYIEDTKIRAIALYDYQAQAEDEISFDPDDIISHIEQVST